MDDVKNLSDDALASLVDQARAEQERRAIVSYAPYQIDYDVQQFAQAGGTREDIESYFAQSISSAYPVDAAE